MVARSPGVRTAAAGGDLARREATVTTEARQKLDDAGRGLYLILTSPRIPHATLARAACELGAPVIQLREKDLPDDELTELALEIVGVTNDTDTLFIMNDRPDIAARVSADGVHLGRDDAGLAEARSLMGPGAIVGLSTRTPAEASAAVAAGADYIGVGPVFRTDTKPDAREPVGLEGLRAVAAAEPLVPKVAIGGIAASDAPSVLRAGADYVAVISAICHADDPVAALEAFTRELK